MASATFDPGGGSSSSSLSSPAAVAGTTTSKLSLTTTSKGVKLELTDSTGVLALAADSSWAGLTIDQNLSLLTGAKLLLDSANSLTSAALQITGDPNTGIAQVGGADTLGLVAGGVEGVRVATAAVTLNVSTTVASGKILAFDSASSLSAVALQVSGDPNTGVVQTGGADTIGLVAGGVEMVRATATAASLGGAPNAAKTLTVTPASNNAVFTGTGGALTIAGLNGSDITILQSTGQMTIGTIASTQPLALRAGNSDALTVAGNLGTQTSGTRKLFAFAPFSIAPTSGTAVFNVQDVAYTINQTGGANGNVTGLRFVATETAVGGTHKLFEFFAGAAGTTSMLALDNAGGLTMNATALATGATTGFPFLRTMAGTPTGAVADGAFVIDTTGNKLWARVGGAWKSVAIA